MALPAGFFAAAPEEKPNILGYGDVHCLGGERSKIATPNMCRLTAGGMIFWVINIVRTMIQHPAGCAAQ